ncbi:uncharacterized protein [Maniola hyperantus]|uniref:uncharacterized protein isoform X1 n=1 Tax=Aphantopus hyperantus TaxID=2795564 RepID=UPI0015697F10|nr:uncharacterized protein LOC117987336 isoform X1 [Maniola hyperantus]XP_034830237.1 uncharacterized protein LOC117987336 isoform X1 [Maniola hyperantus]
MPARTMRAVAVLLAAACAAVSAQIAWTPIFLDGSSQVDLWTQSSSGCTCPGGSEDCACCVRDGACPCGDIAPTRCAQCGLEQYCSNMCNITIDSRVLKNKSGKTFGQIKSPSIEGPGACSYVLQPDAGQRVEIQLYRLVSVGRFNGSSCIGGWLQLGDGSAVQDATGTAQTRLCGTNERYTPPVVLFADHGASVLDFRITDKTIRSQFLAFFSFTSLSNTQGVGFHPRGGSRIPHTDCDWLYQDVSCRGSGTCVLASPGYPGLYPPHRRCRYLFATNSVHTRVKIIFTSIMLPRNHCATDYLTLRAGSSPSAPLLASLCSERIATLEHPGPNLLLEFNSGPLIPPYDYNGFIAKLEFLEKIDTSGPPPTVAASPPLAALTHLTHGERNILAENDAASNEISTNTGDHIGCGATVRGYGAGGIRSGHFDTRTTAWRSQCVIHLVGIPTDVVQVSLFNYNLRLQSCRSHIEILEGLHEFGARGERGDRFERGDRALLRVCGPSVREARDPSGRFLFRQAVTSKGSNLTILVRRATSQSVDEEEFVDGAFAFHDEQHEGTASPDATCASTHYGLASPAHGGVSAPSHHHIFWNIEERLMCTHRFIPASNQSVTIEIQRLDRMWSAEQPGSVATGAGGCRTACGDAGCECRAATPLQYHDHVALVAGDGTHLSCLCGDFQAAWLPVVVRSWTSLRLEYSVAHYTYASRGFDYAAAYSFNDDAMCGQRTYTTHSGEITSRNVTVTGSLNEFFYQQCTWVLDSNVERQLYIDISSEQDKSCSSWNITLHEWSGMGAHSDGGLAASAGDLLYTFCARQKNHTFTLPWRLNTVVIRLVALSRQQPLYTIRWRSQVVRANNRLGPPTPVPAASAKASRPEHIVTTYLLFSLLSGFLASKYFVIK